MANLIHIRNGFIYDIAIKFRKVIVQPEVYTEAYYIIYFFFAYKFLDVKNADLNGVSVSSAEEKKCCL